MGLVCIIDGHHQEYLQRRWVLRCVSTGLTGLKLINQSPIGGDRFTDRIDQEALLDVLVKTEKDHARPTAAIQLQMKESWGWATND